MPDQISALVLQLWRHYSTPELVEQLVFEHVSDHTGHCRVCQVVIPCRLSTIGVAAMRSAGKWEARFR